MSTHNICFRREIRKILCGYPLLSVAMNYYYGIFVSTVSELTNQNLKFLDLNLKVLSKL